MDRLHGADPQETIPLSHDLSQGAFTRLGAMVPAVVVPLDLLKLSHGQTPLDADRWKDRQLALNHEAGDPLGFGENPCPRGTLLTNAMNLPASTVVVAV